MIKIRVHTANDYATLPDIDSGEDFLLSDEEANCLDQIGEFLVREGHNKRFGISLLHNHFPLADEEIMIEEIVGNKVILSPKNKNSVDHSALQASNLYFNPSSSDEMVGLEYILSDKEGVNIFTSSEEEVLRNIRSLLHSNNSLNRFGVWIIRSSFQAYADKIMMESCDPINRILSCELVEKNVTDNINSTQTFWLWDSASSDGKKVVRGCVRVCTRYSDGTHNWGIHNNSY